MSWMDFVAQEWILVTALAGLTIAYFVLNIGQGGKTISVHELTRLVNAGGAQLLDVRENNEFKAGHITGALNIPHAALANRLTELEKSRAKTIILVDKLGQHSATAGKTLQTAGFQVVRLQGGMSEWLHQNLPVVKK